MLRSQGRMIKGCPGNDASSPVRLHIVQRVLRPLVMGPKQKLVESGTQGLGAAPFAPC